MSREGQVGVAGMVFHVEDGDRRWIVWEERASSGGLDLACTCPARHGCVHVAAVLAHLSRNAPGAAAVAEPDRRAPRVSETPLSAPPESSWVSSGMTLPPPPPGEDGSPPLFGDRMRTAAAMSAVAGLVEAFVAHGIGPGHEDDLRPAVEGLVRAMRGVSARDSLRVAADLVDLASEGSPDPARVAAVLEGARPVLDAMDAHVHGEDQAASLEGAYLGRSWAFEDSKREEDVDLLEVARASEDTPFGTRRSATWYLDAHSGNAYVEQSIRVPGDGPRQQPGPFPRRIHANLLMIVPGVHPRPVRLLQWSIQRPMQEDDLLRLKKLSMTSVREVVGLFRRVSAQARSHYPTFVVFAPSSVRASGPGAALEDVDGDLIPLAYGAGADASRALAWIAATGGTVYCTAGLVLWDGRDIAFDPLSVVVETQRGFSLARLR